MPKNTQKKDLTGINNSVKVLVYDKKKHNTRVNLHFRRAKRNR